MEQSFHDRGLKMLFVLQDGQHEYDALEDFREAFKRCQEKNLKQNWITEKECRKLKLSKQHVIVLQTFDNSPNSIFSYLRKSPCMVFGPRCILQCLMKGVPTPDGPAPVYNLTMHGLVVCVSGFKPAQKENLRFKVESMGGIFKRDFTCDVTHLVVCRILGATTAKYSIAAEKRLPVMSEQWIHECWDISQKRYIYALDPPLGNLVCPPFMNLKICPSQINRSKKENLKRIIEAKGGIYTPALSEGETDVLITGIGSGEKYVHAKLWSIPCVSEKWIQQSAEAGYALKFSEFEVQPEKKCSTPEENKTFVDPNFSMISCISEEAKAHVINESIMTDASFVEPCPPSRSRLTVNSQSGTRKLRGPLNLPPPELNTREILEPEFTTQNVSKFEHRTPEKTTVSGRSHSTLRENTILSNVNALRELEKLQMADIKKAGPFLDGLKVYVSGPLTDMMDTVRKVLNRAGATRLDQISEEVSHVLVAGEELTAEEQRALEFCDVTPHVVQISWLLASMKLRHPANTDQFLCFEAQKTLEPSPLSKKGLQMWQHNMKVTECRAAQVAVAQSDINLVKQYIEFAGDQFETHTQMSPVKAVDNDELAKPLLDVEPPVEITKTRQEIVAVEQETEKELEEEVEEEKRISKLFEGLKFWSVSISKEDQTKCKELVEKFGGSWQKPATYVIVPLKGTRAKCPGDEIVTMLWIDDCMERGTILPVEYYHKPWDCSKHDKPLASCVMAISNYVGKERLFLSLLVTELGAKFQEVFAKKKAPERNAEASTHLLCPTPVGDKYKAAVKWKLPVVTKDWLLACAQDGRHIEESPFLLDGDACVSTGPDSTKKVISATPVRSKIAPSESYISDARETNEQSTTPQGIMKVVPSEANSTPLSAIPSRLRSNTRTSLKEHATSTSPGTENFTTPNTSNRSVQFATPSEIKTPVEQYTPYIPPQLREDYVAVSTKTPGSAETDTANMTPGTFEKYLDRRMPGYVDTPDTPYGQTFQKGEVSPATKKIWKKYLNSVPDYTNIPKELPDFCKKRLHDVDNNKAENTETKRSKLNLIDEEIPVKKSLEMELMKAGQNEEEEDSKFDDLKTALVSSSSSRLSTNSSFDSKRDSRTSIDDETMSQNVNKKYKFMISGVGEPEREQMEHLIRELEGECCGAAFDPTATHLITANPTRSEKLLASIASGKWVLHHKYLIDSHKKMKFLKEEPYEWGNPNSAYLPTLTPGTMPACLAQACYRWRNFLQNQDGCCRGAYQGFKAIVHGNPVRVPSIKRLIEAGSGKVLDISPPVTDAKDATHYFSDLQHDFDAAVFQKKNVPLLNFIYLNDYLLQDPSPTPQQWLAKHKMNKSSSSSSSQMPTDGPLK